MNQLGSAFTVFFDIDEARSYAQIMDADTAQYARYFRSMLAEGVYLPPAQFEACFLSTAHEENILEQTLQAHKQALQALR